MLTRTVLSQTALDQTAERRTTPAFTFFACGLVYFFITITPSRRIAELRSTPAPYPDAAQPASV